MLLSTQYGPQSPLSIPYKQFIHQLINCYLINVINCAIKPISSSQPLTHITKIHYRDSTEDNVICSAQTTCSIYYEGSQLDCFLVGQSPLEYSSNSSSTQLIDPKMLHTQISNTISSCASKSQFVFFQLFHDLLTLKGVAQSWNDEMQDIAKSSIYLDQEQGLKRSYKEDERIKEDKRFLLAEVLDTNEGYQRSTPVSLGDMVVERDCLSGKIRVKPRDLAAARDGSLLIEETQTTRTVQHQKRLRELQQESTAIGLSLPEAVKLGKIAIKTIKDFIEVELCTIPDEQESKYSMNQEYLNHKLKLPSSVLSTISFPIQLSDNFLLFAIRLLTLNDLAVKITILESLQPILRRCHKSSKREASILSIIQYVDGIEYSSEI